jgi:hypothetical protein
VLSQSIATAVPELSKFGDSHLARIASQIVGSGHAGAFVAGRCLTIAAASRDGFEVQLLRHARHYVVRLGGIEEAVSSEAEAVILVMSAIGPGCRLRTDYVRGRPVSWTLESMDDNGKWRTLLASGFAGWFQSARAELSTYRQNSAGPCDDHSTATL